MMHRIGAAGLLVCAALASCGREDTTQSPLARTPQVMSVAVSPTTLSLPIGGTRQLSAVVDVDAGATSAVLWTSSDALAATVTQQGVVTGRRAPSNVRVCATARADTTRSSCADVSVTAVLPMERVMVVPSVAYLESDESFSFTAALAFEPPGSTTFTWWSSDTSRVRVDANGRATARAATAGTAVCARPASHPEWFSCASVVVRASR